MNEAPNYNNGKIYRINAIKAAEDLGYSEEVIQRIQDAKCDEEISRIMYSAARTIGE